MAQAYIDVGDGTLILPPPAIPYVPPAAPAPQPAPAPAAPTVAPAPDPRPILRTGKAYIADVDESGNPILIEAPPRADAPAPTPSPDDPGSTVDTVPADELWTHWEQGDPLEPYDLEDLDSEFFAAIIPLRGEKFVSYVRDGCERRNLDAMAVLAEAYHEGISGGIGDGGDSYGPWQLYKNGRLPRMYRSYPKNSPKVNTWAWSTNGIDYALDGMAKVAANLRGVAAVTALTRDYEVPSNWESRNLERIRTYEQLSRLGGGAWAFLAGVAKGPKVVGTPTAVVPTVTKDPTVKIMGAWRGLIKTLRDDVPATSIHLQNSAKRLKGAVS